MPGAKQPVRVLSLSCVYPTEAEPRRGLFVRSRLLALAEFVDIRVVAPVAIIPWGSGRWRRNRDSTPRTRTDAGLETLYPRWLYPPNAGWPNGLLLFLQLLPTLFRLRRRFRWDVLDAHFGLPGGVAAALLSAVFRCRLTITLRGAELDHAGFRTRRLLMGWALRRSHRVIAVSGELKDLALELGVAPSRCVVAANGIDPARFRRKDRSEARTRLGLDLDRKIVLCAGKLNPVKGFLDLLNAADDPTAALPDLRIVIAGAAGRGGGPYERQLRRRSAMPEWRGKLTLLGAIPQEELSEWMNAADVFCLPSRREGCPNVVLEALACGLPVVANRVGAVPDLIPSPGYGTVVEPGNPAALIEALRGALSSEWNRQAIEQWGQSRTWENVARELAPIFEEIPGEPRVPWREADCSSR